MPFVTNPETGESQFIDKSQGAPTAPGLEDYTGGGDGLMSNELLQMVALQDLLSGGKNLSKISAAQDIFGTEPSLAETKAATAKSDALRTMEELENLYFFTDRGPMAYGGEGDFLRKQGRVENFKAKEQSGYNAQLAAYLAKRDSIKPRFARAMGDVGNLSKPEQEQAVKDIPTGAHNFEEAVLFFNSKRATLGLPKRDFSSELQQAGVTQSTMGSGKTIPIKFARPAGVTGQPPTPTQPTDVLKTGLPDIPYQALGGLLGSFLGPVGTGLGTAAGTTLGQIQERGLPLSRGAYEREYGGYGEQLKDIGIPAGLAASVHGLLGGGIKGIKSLLGKGRGVVAKGKTIDPSKAIAETALKAREGAIPSEASAFERLGRIDVGKYGAEKGMSLLKALAEATKRQARGYTLSKEPTRAATGAYERFIAEKGLRPAIAKASPLAGQLTTGISKVINVQDLLKNLGKLLGGSGLVGYGLYKGLQGIGGR